MSVRIIAGDALDQLQSLTDNSVHCCVTSPPYYGLRDYGMAGQIGLEPSPDEYVAALVDVFREVRRVLRKDGTLWLNIGDSYAREGGKTPNVSRHWDGRKDDPGGLHDKRTLASEMGLKPKDLIGIPWMLAFALRSDDWYLRQDIIWSKPNPMPESVTDRCTKSHEYLFLLSKSERYYYDAASIAEVLAYEPHAPGNLKLDASRNDHDQMGKIWGATGTRNRRSVWTVTTEPYPDAHFATFPASLIEPCIKAGTSAKGCCAKCGAQWVRDQSNALVEAKGRHGSNSIFTTGTKAVRQTLGWSPSCQCNVPAVPATVLDPFAGSGTTGMVAYRHGREAILIELNPEYAKMSRQRILNDAGAVAKLFGNPVVV